MRRRNLTINHPRDRLFFEHDMEAIVDDPILDCTDNPYEYREVVEQRD